MCLVCCLGALLALGCKAKPADPAAVEPAAQAAPLAEMGVVAVAVAPFTQVFSETELLFGEVPPGSETAPAASLHALDTNLRAAMRSPAPSDRVPVCMASVPVTGTRALDRWVQIGSCAGVRHLLVPQVAYWAERHGGPMGSDRPAGVVLDFFVVDVQEHSIVGHYRYAESQVPLSANLLTMDKFLARKGQFVLATDLGREGVQQAMKRMGL
ncbi:putative lipoprotein [Megalodesulfovibrio gigas DSM 1382 = ATCC 19364]|uniref:Putative lipoprotein n=1 Tax=Megalodesulfovibrio gigas (strain ATCC 19364 / DSM 1382 / NCIMB 9332 / VKM B-1759) TaxID=1121448 RepID=T2GBJ8_MEGG1|nr:putative lipoprotein [Megalodesulfovibrio gigas DSM 1382 = ATCC 19364]